MYVVKNGEQLMVIKQSADKRIRLIQLPGTGAPSFSSAAVLVQSMDSPGSWLCKEIGNSLGLEYQARTRSYICLSYDTLGPVLQANVNHLQESRR